ncbi:MAG: nitrile hydratase subunit beta [Acidobacteriia bacterium]|nr:nitrile hydratase subunit beta [Terriglobia bacterium]
MNGIHDMGGMQDLGPVQPEQNEPVFHAPWEGRVFAINIALGAWRKWNTDAGRHRIELIPPADYLRMSYYEKWLQRIIQLAVNAGLVTRDEIESGRPAQGSEKATPPFTPDRVALLQRTGAGARRDVPAEARFRAGQRVRARNIHPLGHTRLPRYARGKLGTIHLDHGVYVFPDTNSHFLGENPQHVYSVRFAAQELWGGEASPRDAVYLDMWDNYLDPA